MGRSWDDDPPPVDHANSQPDPSEEAGELHIAAVATRAHTRDLDRDGSLTEWYRTATWRQPGEAQAVNQLTGVSATTPTAPSRS
jgi:hypothetical protein